MSGDFSDAAISGFVQDTNVDDLISSIIDPNTELVVKDAMLQILQENIQAFFVSNRDKAAGYFAQNIMEKVLDSYLRQTMSSQQTVQQVPLVGLFQRVFNEDFHMQDFIAARGSVVKKHCDQISGQGFVDNVVRLVHANHILQTGEDFRNNNIDIFKGAVFTHMQHQNFNREGFQHLLSVFDSLEVTKSHDLFFDVFQIDREQVAQWSQSPQSFTALQANLELQREYTEPDGTFLYQLAMEGVADFADRGFDVSVIVERLCDELSIGSVGIAGSNKEILEEFLFENNIAVPLSYTDILNPFSPKNIFQKINGPYFNIPIVERYDLPESVKVITEKPETKEFAQSHNPFFDTVPGPAESRNPLLDEVLALDTPSAEDDLREMLERAGISPEEIDANLAVTSPDSPAVVDGGGVALVAPISDFDLAVRDPVYLASDGVSSYLRSAAATGKCSEADYAQTSADGDRVYVVNPAISAEFAAVPELMRDLISSPIAESNAQNTNATKVSINWPLSEREHWKFVSVEIDRSDPASITCVMSQLDTDGIKSPCSNQVINDQLQASLQAIYPGCQITNFTERQQFCPAMQINQNCGFVAAVIDTVNKEKFFGNIDGVPDLKQSLEIYSRSLGVELELKDDLVSDIESALGFIGRIKQDDYLFTDASNAAINKGDNLLRGLIVDTFLESPKVPEEEKRKFMDSLGVDYSSSRHKDINVSQDPRYNARSVVMEGGGTRPSSSPYPSSLAGLGGHASSLGL